MNALRKSLTVLGVLMLLCGAAVAVAAVRVDLAPSVCPLCGGNHFPQHPLMSYLRVDLGLLVAGLGLVSLVPVTVKVLSRKRRDQTGP